MSPTHQLELVERYPGLYRHADDEPVPSCEPFAREGFACGDGWFGIIDRLSAKLVLDPNLVVSQVKEKMALLRIYFDRTEPASPEIEAATDAAFDEAREASRHTCELCGLPSPGPWANIHKQVSVRCESCGWLDDMVLACDFLGALEEGKTWEHEARYHARHVGIGATHQPEAVRRRFPTIDWLKLYLWATIDSIEKMEEAEGHRTKAELMAMIFRVTPEELRKFIAVDVPVIKAALR